MLNWSKKLWNVAPLLLLGALTDAQATTAASPDALGWKYDRKGWVYYKPEHFVGGDIAILESAENVALKALVNQAWLSPKDKGSFCVLPRGIPDTVKMVKKKVGNTVFCETVLNEKNGQTVQYSFISRPKYAKEMLMLNSITFPDLKRGSHTNLDPIQKLLASVREDK